jgi:hypothetical protein
MVAPEAASDHPVISSTTERRQAMTSTYDVTSTFVQTIDADRGTTEGMLGRIDPMRSLADRLSALGLDDRAIWSADGPLSYSLIWRFGGDAGHARLDWSIAVEANAADRIVLVVKLAARGSDEAARMRLLRSWQLFEQLAESHAAGLARMIDDYDEEEPEPAVERPRLLAVGMGF